MITSDRLDELETLRPDDDTPDDVKVRIDTGDLRDLVALIPLARTACEWDAAAFPNPSVVVALRGEDPP